MGAGIELACLLLSIMFEIAFWVLRGVVFILQCIFYALASVVEDVRASNKPWEGGYW